MRALGKGIDISYHQGTIDFSKVKQDNIDFVILREGYRFSIDKKFKEYARLCKDNKINILGVYHFSYALDTKSAVKEAEQTIKNISEIGLPKSTVIFFDFEYDTVKKAKEKGVILTKKECIEHTKAFCDTVINLGYKTGVYTNIDFYKNWYDDSVTKKYPIWLADYKGSPNYGCYIQQYSNSGSVMGIKGRVDTNYLYKEFNNDISYDRNKVVKLARSWIGLNEANGSYKKIIDIYNSYPGPLPRGIKMQYDWSWCACTWSALAIYLGYTAIMPIEISCGYLIEAAKKKGIWVEDDKYIPKPGDAILYDWQASGNGNNTGWPDHVGVVECINVDGTMSVIEGNYHDSVDRRIIDPKIYKYIRGYITPRYTENNQDEKKDEAMVALDVLDGKYGNGVDRINKLESEGYDYEEVQSYVNYLLKSDIVCYDKIRNFNALYSGCYKTTSDLNARFGPGTSNDSFCIIPKETVVISKGYYSVNENKVWLYISFTYKDIQYSGFSSIKYLYKL